MGGPGDDMTEEDVSRNIRQAEISEQSVELMPSRQVERVPTGARLGDHRAFRLQQQRKRVPDRLDVIDDEHAPTI